MFCTDLTIFVKNRCNDIDTIHQPKVLKLKLRFFKQSEVEETCDILLDPCKVQMASMAIQQRTQYALGRL